MDGEMKETEKGAAKEAAFTARRSFITASINQMDRVTTVSQAGQMDTQDAAGLCLYTTVSA